MVTVSLITVPSSNSRYGVPPAGFFCAYLLRPIRILSSSPKKKQLECKTDQC